jgi:Carbohydrate esterase 2 N-terminal/GDSL-like Lipase/Acylhydrolase family
MPKNYFISLVFVVISITPGCHAQYTRISFNDAHIRYMGRIAMKDSAAQLAWPGTSVKMNFSGTGVSVLLQDERGDNYFNVILDGKVASILHPDAGKKVYTLASGLPAGKHILELFKRTEWEMGKTWLFQFILDNNTIALEAPPQQKRRMEFFGNSITCGYAVEDNTGQDRGTAPYENGYISYAAITARHFDAAFNSTSKEGIGILVSWFPLIMPEMYDRLDATDPGSKWDFSKYTPDIVVINLFQNDSWLFKMPNHPQFKARFGTTAPSPDSIIRAYRGFVKNIRQKYPKAWIICALGNMDAVAPGAPWPGYIEAAVAPLKDNRLYTHIFPYKNTPGHPKPAEQQAMADDLIAFIEKNIKW